MRYLSDRSKKNSSKFVLLTVSLYVLSGLIAGCDPEHRKKCEWFLVPDEDRIGKVIPEFIPVCARNFTINKQDCRLQAKLDFARSSYNKKFRFDQMKVDGPGIPRTVLDIKFCED